jgi:hypothetical protein
VVSKQQAGEPPWAGAWLVDRSRIETGRACERKRWLGYHAGTETDEHGRVILSGYGRGLSTAQKSIPLETGTWTHLCLERLLGAALAGEELTQEVVQRVVAEAVAGYLSQVEPFRQTSQQPPETQVEVLREQAWLVACFGWMLGLRVVPALLADFSVEAVEQEETLRLDLEGRVWLMSRLDALLRTRNGGRLVGLDLKTSGWPLDGRSWLAQWETSPQLNVGCKAVGERIGEPVDAYYVLGLYKGRRMQEKNYESGRYEGPDRQQSPFCMAFVRDFALTEREWRPTFYVDLVDEVTGETRREGATAKRGWRKVYPWKVLWPTGEQEGDAGAIAAAAGAFVRELPESFFSGLWRLVGPIECSPELIASWEAGVVAEEERQWIPLAAATAEAPEDTPRLLDQLAPQSWDCFKFGEPCIFRGVCLREQGAVERFAARVPHHEQEKGE